MNLFVNKLWVEELSILVNVDGKIDRYGRKRIFKEIYVPQLNKEVAVHLYNEDSNRLGFYSGINDKIYVNLKGLLICKRDIYETICHEWFHHLQKMGGCNNKDHCTEEEIQYFAETKGCWKPGHYLLHSPCEMGAELWTCLLGFRQKHWLSISEDTKMLLKKYFREVIIPNKVYLDEWKRINKKEEMFHAVLDYKKGFK